MQLKDLLRTILNDDEAALIPGSYDRVGDILITSIPEELAHKQTLIGELFLRLHPAVKVVVNKNGMVHRGEYRTRQLTIIAGEQRLVTLQQENGIRLHLDLERMYYSVRSAGERLRIARLIDPGEDVIVLCSGAGPFPLVISAHSDAKSIVGLEKNPVAHQYAQKNLETNRKLRNVTFLQADAVDAPKILAKRFDRVISVLPVDHESILESAVTILKSGGTLHHYAMVRHQDTRPVTDSISSMLQREKKTILRPDIRYCGHCSPGLDRVCFTVSTQK